MPSPRNPCRAERIPHDITDAQAALTIGGLNSSVHQSSRHRAALEALPCRLQERLDFYPHSVAELTHVVKHRFPKGWGDR